MSNHVPASAVITHHNQVNAARVRRDNRVVEMAKWRAQKYMLKKQAWAEEVYQYNKAICYRFFALCFLEISFLLVIRYAFQIL